MPQLYGFQSAVFKSAVDAAKEHREELTKKPGVVGVRAGTGSLDESAASSHAGTPVAE